MYVASEVNVLKTNHCVDNKVDGEYKRCDEQFEPVSFENKNIFILDQEEPVDADQNKYEAGIAAYAVADCVQKLAIEAGYVKHVETEDVAVIHEYGGGGEGLGARQDAQKVVRFAFCYVGTREHDGHENVARYAQQKQYEQAW